MGDQAAFIPFHAINEFMREDFKVSVIRDVVNHLPVLSQEHNASIAHLIRRSVKIPGFRNSEKAPRAVILMPTVKAFGKSPELVSAILSAWADIHQELRNQVFGILKNRNWRLVEGVGDISLTSLNEDWIKHWPVLPPEIDRTKLPGFFPTWPKGEDFETLYNSFHAEYPESNASIDQVSLMVVWLSLRLPYSAEDEQLST